MHKIDGPGATVDNEFTDGDPVGGIQATLVTDDWLNDVQGEIISVLEDQSITPVKGTRNQLLTAIKAIFAGIAQATETIIGVAKVATQPQTNAGTDDATIVTPKKLQAKIAGIVSGQYPITPGAQAVFNHNLGVVPFLVEFSFVCLTAEAGWTAGDVVHRGNWYNNSISTDNSTGLFWYGETTTQVTFGLGSTSILLPTKTTGFRVAVTPANWRFVARVVG